MRRVESPELDLVRRFGSRLFASVFTGPVRDLYRESLGASRGRGNGLRITLELDGAPALMHLPWEYLYEEPSFLAISTWTPVVRSLEIAHARAPLAIAPPLRVLAMVSSPTDVIQLDVAAERQKLEDALAGSVARGAVEIEWLERATLAALQRALRRDDYHVFHFVGHGVFDAEREDGLLLLEEDDGRSREVSGVHLGTMLADERTLRLAVLNACEGRAAPPTTRSPASRRASSSARYRPSSPCSSRSPTAPRSSSRASSTPPSRTGTRSTRRSPRPARRSTPTTTTSSGRRPCSSCARQRASCSRSPHRRRGARPRRSASRSRSRSPSRRGTGGRSWRSGRRRCFRTCRLSRRRS